MIISVYAEPARDFSGEFNSNQVHRLLEEKKWEEAASLLRKLMKENPREGNWVLDLSTALFYLRHRDEALILLNQALLFVREYEKKMLQARIQVLSRQFLTGKTFQFYQDGLNLLNRKKYKLARERFEKSLSEESDNVEVLIRLGQSFLLDGDAGKAIETLTRAKKFTPLNAGLRLWLGRAFYLKGRGSEALVELEFAHAHLPGSEWAPIWFAEALVLVGQWSEGIVILNRDVKKWPLHIYDLITSARLRLQTSHVDFSVLLLARKELQIALNRLKPYLEKGSSESQMSYALDQETSFEVIHKEIQGLMQQVQNRLEGLRQSNLEPPQKG